MVALIEMKHCSWPMIRGSSTVDGQHLDRGVLVEEVERAGAERGGHDLAGPKPLAGACDHPPVHQVDEPVRQQLGVDAQVAVVAQVLQERARDAADAGLDRGAIRHPLCHQAAMARSTSLGRAGATISGRSTSVHPTTWLACTWLRPNVRGIGVDLEEEAAPAR